MNRILRYFLFDFFFHKMIEGWNNFTSSYWLFIFPIRIRATLTYFFTFFNIYVVPPPQD